MCKCTPGIRTPYCGRLGCRPPSTKIQQLPVDQEHISYEFGMLFVAALEMQRGITNNITFNIYNIAGFNAAFNLLTYLNVMCGEDIPNDIADIYEKIVIQIRTLTDKRTTNMPEKLTRDDMVTLFKFILSKKTLLGLSPATDGILGVGKFSEVI